MMRLRSLTALFASVLFTLSAAAAEHRVEVLKEGPPADELSEEIAAQIAGSGFQVIRGTSRAVCDVWLCKQWTINPDFNPTNEVQYPFQPGQLVGIIRFPRDGSDFRDQEIEEGVYTLRYAQQPVDGNHIGTSPTRDFFLLVSAKNDTSPDPVDAETLVAQSTEAANSTHPAMLCLQRPGEGGDLAIRHNEDHDWWIVSVQGEAKAGDTVSQVTIELVVAGTAPE